MKTYLTLILISIFTISFGQKVNSKNNLQKVQGLDVTSGGSKYSSPFYTCGKSEITSCSVARNAYKNGELCTDTGQIPYYKEDGFSCSNSNGTIQIQVTKKNYKNDAIKVETGISVGNRKTRKRYFYENYNSCSTFLKDARDGKVTLPTGWKYKDLKCRKYNGGIELTRTDISQFEQKVNSKTVRKN